MTGLAETGDYTSMRDSAVQFAATFQSAAAVHARNERIIGANDAYAHMLGYESGLDVIGLHVTQILHPSSLPDSIRDAGKLRDRSMPLVVTRKLIRKDSSIIKAFLLKSLVTLGDTTCVLMTFIDHEPVAAPHIEDELRWQAHHDQLTGLCNRHGMQAAIDEQAEQMFPGCVWSIDLRNLKGINDTHGHHVGDEYLTQFASHLGRLADLTGVEAARWGGDEFVIVARLDRVDVVAAHLDAALDHQVSLSVVTLTMRARVGKAFVRDQSDFDSALRDADTEMITQEHS
jgi:diguanylate cyclase (GGDEF)-like protein/PAS domain S-box-containing protein